MIHGHSQKAIAQRLGRSPSTVSREISRNSRCRKLYRVSAAQKAADKRRGEITRDYKIDRPEIHKIVSEDLERNRSPEQISETFRDESGNKRISHQTIYEYLWGLDKGHLHQRSMRRRGKRPRRCKPGFLCRLVRRRSIHARPKVARARRRIGDWEMDLMTCKDASGYLITAVDRASRLTLFGRSPDKTAGRIRDGIANIFSVMPSWLVKTLTFDNGTEYYYHESLEQRLGVKAYSADPYKSGQRGTNENTNGLIRQYFPRCLHYGLISHWDGERVQAINDDGQRKVLDLRSPRWCLEKHAKIAIHF